MASLMASLRHGFEEPRDVQDIRLVVDTIATLAWSAGRDGSADFFNQRWLDYTGLSAKQALDWGWKGCDSSRRSATNSGNIPGSFEFYKAV
jgi:hypothetical protein